MKTSKKIFLCIILSLACLPGAAQESVLASGNWFKVSVEKNGVYKINYDLLKKMGVNPAEADPRKIKIFGNKGGMLPQAISETRPVDLVENAIFVQGESDGKFDRNDFILFYAEGPDQSHYDLKRNIFRYENNLYGNENFYFLAVGADDGKRMQVSEDLGQGFPVIDHYSDFAFYENDVFNLLHSGREWFGETFGVSTLEHAFTFNARGIVPGSQLKIVSSLMGETFAQSSMKLSFNNTPFAEQILLPIANTSYGIKGLHRRDTFLLAADEVRATLQNNQEFKFQFTKGMATSKSYLDFFLVTYTRGLSLDQDQITFTCPSSINNTVSGFQISGFAAQALIWDITDPANATIQNFSLANATANFATATTELKKFVAFSPAIPAPKLAGKISTQNLRGLSASNLIIVTHPAFRAEAERLAAHRSSFSGWSVNVVTTSEIFHEFSSGRPDVTAIRDFVKVLYDKSGGTVKALLLFGKGSYDYKNVLPNNKNFVITYESRNSLHPLQTFSSDDYYGFLENNEGTWPEDPAQNYTLDIGVGRLPVTTAQEAKNVVDKIIAYDTNKKSLGYWRKKIVFVADDGNTDDGFTTLHQYQADQLAQFIDGREQGIDTRKLYMGTYAKTVQPNRATVPQMEEDIVRAFNTGSLIINYTGHGSEKQWADEKVFSDNTISTLDNKLYPFLVTATCEFGRHDDPATISSAELVVKAEKAGAIGIVTTARPVNATTNFNLNLAFYEALLEREGNLYVSIGDVFRQTKNNSTSGVANRNFSLLADPSMTLVLPPNTINVTQLETATGSDTLKALSTVFVTGDITNSAGEKLNDFNGTVEVTLFDKKTEFITTGQNNPAFSYSQWHNALFRGKATVTQGSFALSFTLPKNIAYQVGPGKFSLYAADPVTQRDASSSTTSFKIGGSEPNVVAESTPPTIELYMGDTTFVEGGLTSPDTYLVAYIRDNTGVNISGYGVGNNIIAVLDNDSKVFSLNDYYVAEVDDASSGWIHYPLTGLPEGKHRLSVLAWDVHNNASEATIEFIVTNGEVLRIESFGNFPNPFRDKTTLFFTHNRSGDDLQAQVFIHNVSGEILKTFEFMVSSSNYSVNLMELNSPADFDKKLSPGLYLARLIVRSLSNGSKNEQVTKLIILN
jgi:hypothetical protein